ncbi:LUD domain-containing protein [Sphingomonas sp. H39-1-10]|uniref:LutC/YkgG family protein n=1 Tax=Sphingomonas pollutisoli TaxID=3030829 RepID=UPI0023B96047|nr:LUD domain-containing protein [Sphingomonas pollutisoli]MDF0488192.1 LUD domain-containing protein [Sphingomonas pollutisoli]
MNAREEILGALGTAAPPPGAAEALLVDPVRPAVAEDRVSVFLAALALPASGATHARIASVADAPGAVARYLAEHGLPPAVFLPDDPRFAADWSGFTLSPAITPDEPAVIAWARLGIAETGSLVFETGPHAPMLPNFLGLHHIVLLREAAIVSHLEDAALPGPQPRAHYWVTGVSGTTDIEGQYIRGAHGPRFLHVLLVGEE